MGLFDVFRKHERAEWPPYEVSPLVLRIGNSAEVLGVRLGEPESRLETIGRPDNKRPSRDEAYHYLRLGLEVETDSGAIDDFEFHFVDILEKGWAPCALRYEIPGGGALQLSAATRVDEVRDALGEPDEADQDDCEIVLYYHVAGFELEFEFDASGTLDLLNVFRS